VTIVETLDHRDLFASAFQTGDWSRWKTFLGAAYGLDLSPQDLELYRQCTGRETPPVAPAREVYAICGRRSGKSRVAALVAAHVAAQDYRDRLAVGEWATVACIAPDRAQAQVVFSYIRALLRESTLLRRLVARETADTLELRNRVRVEVGTASHRTTRGYTFAAIVIDEMAFLRSDDSSEPAEEILRAVKPGLATLDGIVIGISSPYARRGALWQKFRRYYGKDGPVLVWRAASTVMNPTLPPSIVEDALAEDEAAARAEYLAEFRSDVESFVSRDALEACVIPGRRELPPASDTHYVAGIDPSGGSSDSFTMAVAHHERRSDAVVAVLDCVREVRPPFSPDAVAEEFAGVLKSYRLTSAVSDRYAGQWPVETFGRHGIHLEQAAQPKSDLYGALLPLLNSARVELLEDRRLEAQLLGLERRTSRAGRDSIDHAPGGHDDRANSAALALTLAAAQGRDTGEVLASGLRDPNDLPPSLVFWDSPGPRGGILH
jgi:hypothetical protein